MEFTKEEIQQIKHLLMVAKELLEYSLPDAGKHTNTNKVLLNNCNELLNKINNDT